MSEKEFLEEYISLVRKHRVYIGACGCCDSPFLETVSNESWTGMKFVPDPTGEIQIKQIEEHLSQGGVE